MEDMGCKVGMFLFEKKGLFNNPRWRVIIVLRFFWDDDYNDNDGGEEEKRWTLKRWWCFFSSMGIVNGCLGDKQ